MKIVKLKDISVGQGNYGIGAAAVEYNDNLYRYLRITDIKEDGTVDINELKSVDDINAKDYLLKENDICFARTGNSTGKTYFYDGTVKDLVYAGFLIKFSLDNTKVNPKYIKYYTLSNKYKNWVKEIQTGSTRGNINAKMYGELVIELPEREYQDKSVKLLETITKRIELNKHTNNNLYEIGKALYQEYFENEEYTNNYEIKQLNEVTTNNRNKVDQTKEYKVLSAVNTGDLVLSDDYFDKQVYSKDIGKYLNVNKYDFAYNPARINIGSIGLNTFDFNCCVSPVYVTFSVDKDYIDFFDFYFKSKRFNAEVVLRASGSVRQALNYNDFGLIEIPYPSKEMIDKFNSSYKTIKDRINKNKAKISNLEQIRDTLLPKLMNGEIDLDKIEI
ncbi:MAG: restriction endonuclease subunit S [Clostridia bacterium]|nr:restriction endonuclease subunit S [Clostridia bacterium]